MIPWGMAYLPVDAFRCSVKRVLGLLHRSIMQHYIMHIDELSIVERAEGFCILKSDYSSLYYLGQGKCLLQGFPEEIQLSFQVQPDMFSGFSIGVYSSKRRNLGLKH